MSDKEKVIEWIKGLAERTPMPGARSMYQAAYYLLTQSLWISVEERLPEGCALVLVWRPEEGSVDTDWYDKDHGEWYCFPGVTHWMPLPEPPEGGTEE